MLQATRSDPLYALPWACFESSYTLCAVSAVWREGFGSFFEGFQTRFLERASLPARFYPCPHHCGCAHEVIQHGPEDFVAVCRCEPWRCPDLKLEPADVVCWKLSWTRLGRALCKCFGGETRVVDLGLFNTKQIGSWSSASIPLILTLQPETGRFHQVLLELISRMQTSFILFAPTTRHLAPGVSSCWPAQRRRASIFRIMCA